MKREDIDKAASDYAEENSWYPGETSYESDIIAIEESFADAFKAGAEWRINSVWHDASEEPTEREMLAVIDKDGDMTQNDFMIDEFIGCNKWSAYVKDVGIIKWCYRKDLIPNKEE